MILIVDNYDSFTYNLYQALASLTDEYVEVVRNDRIDLAGVEKCKPSALVLSPGPGRPEEAKLCVELVRAFTGRIPILGVCLGHQAIAYAFGSEIARARAIVHGKTEEVSHDGRGLFRGLPSPSTFARYHSLAVASLSPELEVSARAADGEIMGIRHRLYPVEGVQFHPESAASPLGRRLLSNFFSYRRDGFPFRQLLSSVIRGSDLTRDEAEALMEELTEGRLDDAQVAGFLAALQAKGPSAAELAGMAGVLRRKRVAVAHDKPVLDTCGTGGDGSDSFNISSMAALVSAACGAPTAKHGNRGVSSSCGSADFFSALGMNLEAPPETAAAALKDNGFAFLYAPRHHAAMRHAAGARKSLGIRTAMNLLGPLCNPCAAEYQLIGVWDESYCRPMAEAAAALGALRVLAVHSEDGMDELSPNAPSLIVEAGKKVASREYRFDPAELGIPRGTHDDLKGGDARTNADIAVELASHPSARMALRHAAALNAGAGLYAAFRASSIADGYKQAMRAMADGSALRLIKAAVSASGARA